MNKHNQLNAILIANANDKKHIKGDSLFNLN